jgi:hypothetical protein
MDSKTKNTAPREKTAVLVRLPHDVKAWIQREASHNGASQNSEIIRSIRARMETHQSRSGQGSDVDRSAFIEKRG